MSLDQKKVLFLSKENLELWAVNGKKKTSLFQSKYDKNFLDLCKKISKEYGFKGAKILFSDDLCYLLNINVPYDKVKNKEFIQILVQQQIPEILESKDWDYKALGKVKDSKDPLMVELVVFSPVKKYLNLLRETGWMVFVLEPELVAKTRDKDPVVSIANRRVSSGKDEDVLNMQIIPSENSKQLSSNQSKPKLNKILLILIIILGLALGLAIAWFELIKL